MGEGDRMARVLALALALGVAVVSIPSIMRLPFGPFLGWDFQNIHAFQNSEYQAAPYLVDGEKAGDRFGRDMIYPPLLYFSFFWLRGTVFEQAALGWAIFILAGVTLMVVAYLRMDAKPTPWLAAAVIAMLFSAQYPTVFAAERGNVDVVILLLWTGATLAFSKKQYLLSGLLAGLAAHYKLYPAFSIAAVGAGLLLRDLKLKKRAAHTIPFLGGVAIAFVLGIAVAPRQFFMYATRVLPSIANDTSVLTEFSHSFRRLFPRGAQVQRMIGYSLALGMGMALLVVWAKRAFQALAKDPIVIFAGALALSTYYAGIAYDYNLTTTYPLLALLAVRTMQQRSRQFWYSWSILMVGLVAIIGHRGIFAVSPLLMKVHILTQWVWLMLAGLFMPESRLPDPEAKITAT